MFVYLSDPLRTTRRTFQTTKRMRNKLMLKDKEGGLACNLSVWFLIRPIRSQRKMPCSWIPNPKSRAKINWVKRSLLNAGGHSCGDASSDTTTGPTVWWMGSGNALQTQEVHVTNPADAIARESTSEKRNWNVRCLGARDLEGWWLSPAAESPDKRGFEAWNGWVAGQETLRPCLSNHQTLLSNRYILSSVQSIHELKRAGGLQRRWLCWKRKPTWNA